MKNKLMKRILLVAVLMVIISSFAFATQASNKSSGFLDIADTSLIQGWAYDRNNPNELVDVHIYIYPGGSNEALAIIPVRADQYRSDLAAAGIGSGEHAFSYEIDWDNLPEYDIYRVEAYAITKSGNPRLENVQTYSSKYNIVSSLGTFQATAYCPCKYCTWGTGITSTGAVPKAKHTISVDTRYIPFGTKLLIDGIVYTAEDRGGGIKGNHVDIFFNTHQEALNYGRQNVQVYIVE